MGSPRNSLGRGTGLKPECVLCSHQPFEESFASLKPGRERSARVGRLNTIARSRSYRQTCQKSPIAGTLYVSTLEPEAAPRVPEDQAPWACGASAGADYGYGNRVQGEGDEGSAQNGNGTMGALTLDCDTADAYVSDGVETGGRLRLEHVSWMKLVLARICLPAESTGPARLTAVAYSLNFLSCLEPSCGCCGINESNKAALILVTRAHTGKVRSDS